MTSNPSKLPTEVHQLIIDELGADLYKGGWAALRSCLFVSAAFNQCARRHLFRKIELHDAVGSFRIRKRLLLLRELLNTTANNHDPGIVSNIRTFSLLLWFEDDGEGTGDSESGENSEDSESEEESEQSKCEEDLDGNGDEESGGEDLTVDEGEGVSNHFGDAEDASIMELAENFLPGIIKSLLSDASRLRHVLIQDNSTHGCNWDLLSWDLRLALQSLLRFRNLRSLELRNFIDVPNNIFDGANVTHLITDSFHSMDQEREDLTPSSSFRGDKITFPPLESLETDQRFPLQWILNISIDQSSDTSRTSLLKTAKIDVLNVVDFNKAVYLLRAAYLLEDLSLTLVPLESLQNVAPPATKLDFLPLQKLTQLTLFHIEELTSFSPAASPRSVEQVYTMLNSASPYITSLTLDFFFTFPTWAIPMDQINGRRLDEHIYQPKQEHWKLLDVLLSGPSYPALCRVELRVPAHPAIRMYRSNRNVDAAMEKNKTRFRDAFPLLSAADKLAIYLES